MKFRAFVVWMACTLAMALAGTHAAAAGLGAQARPAASAVTTGSTTARELALEATFNAYLSARASRYAWTGLWVLLGLVVALFCGVFVASYYLRYFGAVQLPQAGALTGRRYALIAAAVAFTGLAVVMEASLAKLDSNLYLEKAAFLRRLAAAGCDHPPVDLDS